MLEKPRLFHLKNILKTQHQPINMKKKSLHLNNQPNEPKSIFQFGKCEIRVSKCVDFAEGLGTSGERSKDTHRPGLAL